VALSGTGVIQLPVASISPPTLAFGAHQIGSVTMLDATLTNSGTGATPMTINSIVVSGAGFSRIGLATTAGGCGSSLAAGANCTIRVRFAPTSTTPAAASGSLVVSDNSNNVAGSAQTVALTGTSAAVVANNDTSTVVAGGTTPQTIAFNVRANDVPVNSGTVSIVSSTKTNGGATAVASVNASNQVVWTLTTPASATTTALRQASKRGTYTVNYQLTVGTGTATATYTLTIN